jgi:hypothetical protein
MILNWWLVYYLTSGWFYSCGWIRDSSLASSAHVCLLSPGRLSTTACRDYCLFIWRLSSTANGINALGKAGIFQEYIKFCCLFLITVSINFLLLWNIYSLLELVASSNHDCYLKVITSRLNLHVDGYSR